MKRESILGVGEAGAASGCETLVLSKARFKLLGKTFGGRFQPGDEVIGELDLNCSLYDGSELTFDRWILPIKIFHAAPGYKLRWRIVSLFQLPKEPIHL